MRKPLEGGRRTASANCRSLCSQNVKDKTGETKHIQEKFSLILITRTYTPSFFFVYVSSEFLSVDSCSSARERRRKKSHLSSIAINREIKVTFIRRFLQYLFNSLEVAYSIVRCIYNTQAFIQWYCSFLFYPHTRGRILTITTIVAIYIRTTNLRLCTYTERIRCKQS